MSRPIAANDPSRIPPLDQATVDRLKRAYDQSALAYHGTKFEDALADDLVRLALLRTAEAMERKESGAAP